MKTPLLLLGAVLLLSLRPAHAQIRDDLAVRAIMGEASGEGYKGMLAVAGAIRNRQSLNGVYGLHAKHSQHESKATWDLARKAWAESATQDITGAATHWDNVSRKTPYWAKSMVVTIRIGRHTFYRPRHNG